VAFTKLNAETGMPLPGVTFQLLENGFSVGKATTGIDGLLDLGFFTPGTYSLIETATPPGFDPFPPAVVVVGKGGAVTINGLPNSSPILNTPTAPEIATIIVNHMDSMTGALLQTDTFTVSPGIYGPFMPLNFPGYTFIDLAPGSAPAFGFIKAGQTITITFLYQETATINVNHVNNATGAILEADTFLVSSGAYGPYLPITIPGFTFIGLAQDSAPPSGTIAAGQTLTITFLYTPLV